MFSGQVSWSKWLSLLYFRHMKYMESSHCLMNSGKPRGYLLHLPCAGYHREGKTPSCLPAKHCWSLWLPVLLTSAWIPDAFQLYSLSKDEYVPHQDQYSVIPHESKVGHPLLCWWTSQQMGSIGWSGIQQAIFPRASFSLYRSQASYCTLDSAVVQGAE